MWVVRGVARVHRGREAREVQGKARKAGVQVLRLAEKVLMESLWHLREADAVTADLGKSWTPQAQRTSRPGRRGNSLQLVLLHAREGAVRRVLAFLPPRPGRFRRRGSHTRSHLPGGLLDIVVRGAP